MRDDRLPRAAEIAVPARDGNLGPVMSQASIDEPNGGRDVIQAINGRTLHGKIVPLREEADKNLRSNGGTLRPADLAFAVVGRELGHFGYSVSGRVRR